jgi:hypothetical protein
MDKTMYNFEIVTLAVYLLGGKSRYIDTEDIAVKANELSPGRFAWKKYPEQINLDKIRSSLSDARKDKYGSFLIGSLKDGWILINAGLIFAQKNVADFKEIDISVSPLNIKESLWQDREKSRMLASIAFEKVNSKNTDTITQKEAEGFFRVDEYVTGKARERKLDRIIKVFGNDPELGRAIKILAEKVRRK